MNAEPDATQGYNVDPERYDGWDRTDQLVPGLTGCPACDVALEASDFEEQEPVMHITQSCPECDYETTIVRLGFPRRGYRVFSDPAKYVNCDELGCENVADAVAVDSRRRRIETRCIDHEPCAGHGDLDLSE